MVPLLALGAGFHQTVGRENIFLTRLYGISAAKSGRLPDIVGAGFEEFWTTR